MVEQRTVIQLLRDLCCAQEIFSAGPRIVITNSTLNNPASSKRPYWAVRRFENCGVVAVYWAVGAVPSAAAFNGILKACTTQDDGTGGVEDFSRFNGDIYIAAATGNPRVAVFEGVAREGTDT